MEVGKYSNLVYKSIYYSLVPLLSTMMDFLWLVYRKYKYKYTMIRWTWYIEIRILVLFLLQYPIPLSLDNQIIYSFLTYAILQFSQLSIIYNFVLCQEVLFTPKKQRKRNQIILFRQESLS